MDTTLQPSTYTILVVEDEKLLLEAIIKKLQLQNFVAIGCVSGEEAMAILEKNPVLPDAIWLDYYLKDMNGMEFMMQVRQHPRFAAIPVMVVSNSASTDKVNRMLALGVSKYLLKADHQLSELIAMIGTFIREEKESQHV